MSKSSVVCACISLFLIFRALKLKYAYPPKEHEQLCQRGRLITENKGHQERIETLMGWGSGTMVHPSWISWEVKPPSSKARKRSEELCTKMQQIHQHKSFRGRTAGTTEAVQEARLVLVAESSKSSAEH